jgi:hypothetical protein
MLAAAGADRVREGWRREGRRQGFRGLQKKWVSLIQFGKLENQETEVEAVGRAEGNPGPAVAAANASACMCATPDTTSLSTLTTLRACLRVFLPVYPVHGIATQRRGRIFSSPKSPRIPSRDKTLTTLPRTTPAFPATAKRKPKNGNETRITRKWERKHQEDNTHSPQSRVPPTPRRCRGRPHARRGLRARARRA